MEKKILETLLSVRPEGEFLNSDNFILDGLLDSFDIVILVSDLDKKFNISIEGIDIIANNFINLESITTLVSSYSKNK
jgi:acyl carrier protein|tara:strand:+ start:418 stop:651 length:234 start_codon:yes stop_codon:yes gene_type:complete